jgi:hypothetical protein
MDTPFRGHAGAVLQGGRPSAEREYPFGEYAVRPKHLLIQVNHDLETLAAGSRHGIAGQELLGELHRAISPRGPARFRGNTAGFMSATHLATEVDDKVARRGMHQLLSQAQRL